MSFLKTKKFWIPFSVVGVGIVAIGTGVGIHQRNQNAINIYEGNSRGEIRTKLKNALNTISPSDIRVNLNSSPITRKSLTKTASESGLYAFNVSSNQLGLSSNVSVPSGIQISFELDKDKNTLETLNNGVLNIKLVATTPFSDQVENRTIQLNSFKKADEKLGNLLTNTNNESVLEIKQTQETNKYKTIEQLNAIDSSISGLTSLLRSSNQQIQSSNNLSIQGEVKLDRIALENGNVYFYLTSANANDSLKLVETSNSQTKQILFKEVKLTNLAASEVVAIPNGYSSSQSAQFGSEFKKTNNKLDLGKEMNQKVELNINPFYVQQRTTTNQTSIGIQVRFGQGENTKIYDSNRASDLKLLKDASFSFNIWSMKITMDKNPLSNSDLSSEKTKLEMIFKQDHFSMPSSDIMAMNKGFKKTENTNTNLMSQVLIDTNNTSDQRQRREARMQQTTASKNNWLVFVDYSYKGINSSKVLLTPSISIIHLDRNIPVQTTPAKA